MGSGHPVKFGGRTTGFEWPAAPLVVGGNERNAASEGRFGAFVVDAAAAGLAG
jgi:hypothetical protein